MSSADIDTLLQRNSDYVGGRFPGHLGLRSTFDLILVGCADPRVDPAAVFGLDPGDLAVVRNIGGRVYPDTVATLALLASVGRIAMSTGGPGPVAGPSSAPPPGGDPSAAPAGRGRGPLHIALLHHDECGITVLAREPEPLARAFGIGVDDLAGKAVLDPRRSLEVDAELLRSHPALPAGTLVTGLHYDIATGVVDVVVPTAAADLPRDSGTSEEAS